MKVIFANVFVVIGCVVGAGFMSGRELFVFFAESNPVFVSLLFFSLFLCMTLLFFCMGKKYDTDNLSVLNKRLFSKWSGLFDCIFLSNCFFSVSAMIAGLGFLYTKLGFTGCILLIATLLLCEMVLCCGLEGVQKLNLMLVPVMMVLLFIVSFLPFGEVDLSVEIDDVQRVLRYVSYNGMLMCGVLLGCGKNMSKKQSFVTSAVASAILSLLIFFVLSSFCKNSFEQIKMPLLFLAGQKGLEIPFAVVMCFGIITSLVSAAYPLAKSGEKFCKDKFVFVSVMFVCAYLVSMLGFDKILDYILPIASVFSLAFVFCAIVKMAKK